MARELLCGCVGGINESNTVNKQDGWGEREGEEREKHGSAIYNTGGRGRWARVYVAFKGFFCGMLDFF